MTITSSYTISLSSPLCGTWVDKGEVHLMVKLTSGRHYFIPVSDVVTPFEVQMEGKEYYVSAQALMDYQDAWSADISSPIHAWLDIHT